MKPFPNHNFPVSVRKQIWEEEPQVAAFYQDIFDVRLNFTISIMFVPNLFQMIQSGWVPTLPDDVDAITTELEARLVTIALSKYIVTPDQELAGTEIVLRNTLSGRSDVTVLFYVTPQEFKTFSIELSSFAEELPSVHASRQVSEVDNLEFVRLLLSRIIPSPHLSEDELHLLERVASV